MQFRAQFKTLGRTLISKIYRVINKPENDSMSQKLS